MGWFVNWNVWFLFFCLVSPFSEIKGGVANWIVSSGGAPVG
jgi:hypothetical protein